MEFNLKKPSLLILISSNLIVGILAIIFQWSLAYIVFIYWIENLIIGFINIFKMLFIKRVDNKGKENKYARFGLIPFFIIHYYGFCAAHGLFIFFLIALPEIRETVPESHMLSYLKSILNSWEFIIAVGSIFISHLASFFLNYIRKKEFQKITLSEGMRAPYKRIIFVHVFIIAVGFFVVSQGYQAAWLMLLFVVMKTGIDVIQHQSEHKKLGSF